MFKINLDSKNTIRLLIIVCIAMSNSLFSQTKYTVVLPDIDVAIPKVESNNLLVAANNKGVETAKSFFKFNLQSLPENAIVSDYSLKMYRVLNTTVPFFRQQITVLKGPNTWTGAETSLNTHSLSWADIKKNKPIGKATVTKSSPFITVKLKASKFSPIKEPIVSLAARSPEKNESTEFYSVKNAEASKQFSTKSKLLLEYEVSNYPFRMDWAQSFGDATHNSYLKWKTNTTITEAKATILPNPSKDRMVGVDYTGTLSIYQNQPILFTQAAQGSTPFGIKQLDAKGNVLWSTTVDNKAKSWPVIDEKGRMYYFSISNTLTVLDLNNSGKVIRAAEPLSIISQGQISAVDQNVTIGYDGTLYLSSATDGVVALSAYPQLKLRWKYLPKTNERNGPVSLSTDESNAFFINVSTTQETGRLVMLDNMDGTVLSTSEMMLGGYQNDGNFYIPPPVVRNDDTVFVLNGFDTANTLFVFKEKDSEIIRKDTIDAGNAPRNEGISQAVIDNKNNVFFVYNNKIAFYDPSKENKVNVYNGPEDLNNASILITDASSNIYASDVYSTSKKILGFSYGNKAFKHAFSVEIDTNTKKNLALASDGTLYTVTDNNLIAITPKTVSETDVILSKKDLNTNTVYRATNTITVEGFEVKPTINTILYSGGGMSFQSGFSVRKGAQITCKTGY